MTGCSGLGRGDREVSVFRVDDPDRRRNLDPSLYRRRLRSACYPAGQHRSRFPSGADLESHRLCPMARALEALEALVHGGEVGGMPPTSAVREACDRVAYRGDGVLRLFLGPKKYD